MIMSRIKQSSKMPWNSQGEYYLLPKLDSEKLRKMGPSHYLRLETNKKFQDDRLVWEVQKCKVEEGHGKIVQYSEQS